MAKNPDDTAEPFRFLDLPPELRNRVYHYVFEGRSQQDIELFAEAKSFAPHMAVTAVSQQLRTESQGLYVIALKDFWTTHHFYIRIRGQERPRLSDLLSQAKQIPVRGLARLEFRIQRDDNSALRWDVQLTVDGGVEWRLWSPDYVPRGFKGVSEGTPWFIEAIERSAALRDVLICDRLEDGLLEGCIQYIAHHKGWMTLD
ncbi:hypothetical protein LTR36_004779 [Oleoguttula mirabilis]|uniref:Uncharacterized protein n=1 Tax=Oleoguttula mirabilis TaxID=1507867 RepID=A0AAV9JFN6_9PEZI|nr:hypothetical protein LTR36_004779 [Oleoguttula mirabilis]